MLEPKPDFEGTFRRILIGSRVRVLHGLTEFQEGIVMDKYLTEENVALDIYLNNGQVLEHKNFFVGNREIVSLLP
jgi:hypothetical protein